MRIRDYAAGGRLLRQYHGCWQAADYYRKVISFARRDPTLYDPQFENYYQELIASLDPTASMGALPPNPRDI